MKEINSSKSSTRTIPAADLKVETQGDIKTETCTYPLRQPQEDKEDFFIRVRASTLKRCRRQLLKIRKNKFPFGEFLLAIFTLCFGAVIGAWLAGIKMNDYRAFSFYIILPVTGAVCLVAYIFYRKMSVQNPAEIASEILADLPDPECTSEIKENHEPKRS